jgi:hypothetical protein
MCRCKLTWRACSAGSAIMQRTATAAPQRRQTQHGAVPASILSSRYCAIWISPDARHVTMDGVGVALPFSTRPPRATLCIALLVLKRRRQASRAGELHPRALPEPYVNLSAHTAPSVRPWPYRSGQWANRSGDDRTTRASQSRAPFGCCLRRLNLRRAHRMRNTSIRRNVGYNADL